MSNFPQPLVAANVDLRDFAFMPLDVVRLRDSDLAALESPEACWAAVLLWCASWHQVPAASIPDDDRVLANLAGFGRVVKEWQKVRDGALRGWVLCRDGRFYHPVVAEKALDAWRSKLEQRWRTECARVKKHNQRHGLSLATSDFEEWLSQGCPQGHTLPVPEDKPPSSPRTTPIRPRNVSRETHSKGQGEGQGKGIEKKDTHAHPSSSAPTAAGAICQALKAAGIANVNPGHPGLLVLLQAGASEAEFVGAAPKASGKNDPFGYVLKVVEGQRRDAAQSADGLHRGPLPANETPFARQRREMVEQMSGGRVSAKAPGHQPEEIFDDASPPIPLG